MSLNIACKTPLVDLLRNVPMDARMTCEHNPTSHSCIPVGRLFAEAAEAIDALTQERDRLRELIPQAWHMGVKHQFLLGAGTPGLKEWMKQEGLA